MGIDKSKSGFTLVEMLIVVAIIGIFIVLAVPQADEWYKVQRVHDAALRFASTLERTKVSASRAHRPLVVAYIDDNHYAVYSYSGTLENRLFQPDSETGYTGNPASDPWGGGTVPNPMPSRLTMGQWTGIFSGGVINTVVVMPEGTFHRFVGADFSGTTAPLGDIYRVSFIDNIVQQTGNDNMKELTSWRVDVEPAGNISVTRLHAKED